MSSLVNRVGQRYTNLTVIARAPNGPAKQTRWQCRCDCGKETIVDAGKLASGNTKSCGCYIRTVHTKHGGYLSTEYHCWEGMIRRCCAPQDKNFHRYGGRGIMVCDRWRDFANFLDDMGPRPSMKHSIERMNNDLGYTPDNCKWATQHEQTRNTRTNIYVTIDEKRFCLKDAAKKLGISYSTVMKRLRLGWTINKALFEPVRH